MTSKQNNTDECADRPILNVVSTIRSAQSPPLKWQVHNFGLFLTSKAKSIYQSFGPLHNATYLLSLSKRQSPQNEDDKLELAISSYNLNGQEATAQLKGRIWMSNEEGWTSEFALNFTDSTRHYFATPISSFNEASVLTIGDMIFEQIIVDTDVLGSWVMRLDDSCIMSRSIIEHEKLAAKSNEEEEKKTETESVLEDAEVVDVELVSCVSEVNVEDSDKEEEQTDSISELDVVVVTPSPAQTETLDTSSVEVEPSECLEVTPADAAEFSKPPLVELPDKVESLKAETTTLTPQALQKIDQEVGSLIEKLCAQPLLVESYQKVYKNLDDNWLKSLDEMLTQSNFGYDLQTLKKEVVDLKRARKELYDKLRQHFQLFPVDFLLFGLPSEEQKQNLNELCVLIDYFEAILKKLAKNQAELDENTSLEDEYWLFAEFPDCSQETKWLDDYNKVRHTNNEQSFLAQEIRLHATQQNKLSSIQRDLNNLWKEYSVVSKSANNEHADWINETERVMERMHIDISDCELQCLQLFIRPANVETFGEMRCKLAQLQSNIAEMFKHNNTQFTDPVIEYELDNLYHSLISIRKTMNEGHGRLMLPNLKEQIETVKQTIKDLDKGALQSGDQLRLEDLKDSYDELRSMINELDSEQCKPAATFNKAIKSISQLHSNFSYTMETADSETLINYEVELCKCLAELEASITCVRDDQMPGVQFWREHYNLAKRKTDWVAETLRERLEPWRQFMDLYTSIEQAHKAVGELVSQVAAKPDNGYNETCQDIEMLETVNSTFEATRKDIAYIRRLCSAGQMKSTGLAAEAARRLQRVDQAHRLVENGLNSLMFKLKAKTVNPFYGRGRRGHRHRRNNGGSSYDPYYNF